MDLVKSFGTKYRDEMYQKVLYIPTIVIAPIQEIGPNFNMISVMGWIVSPPNAYVEILNPVLLTVFGDRAFQEW